MNRQLNSTLVSVRRTTNMNNWSGVITFACFVIIAQAVVWEDGPSVARNCGKRNGLDIQLIRDVAVGVYPPINTRPTENVIQHIVCCLTDMTWLNTKGEWNKDNINTIIGSVISETEKKKILDECAINKDTPEKSAEQFWKCAHPLLKKHVIINL